MSTEAKLMPPILPDQLRAGYGNVLTVNFQQNRTVSLNNLYLELKIRTIPNNLNPIDAYETEHGTLQVRVIAADVANGYVTFSLSNDDSFENYLNIGQYYKVQMKYVKNSDPIVDGYISNVGIMKYTSIPEVDVSSDDNLYWIGTYSQEQGVGDYSEKVYKYKFDLLDNIGDEIVESTGWIMHDSSRDENEYSSYDSFQIYHLYQQQSSLSVRYSVQTTNNLPQQIVTAVSDPFNLWGVDSWTGEDPLEKVELNFDNGQVYIKRKPLTFQYNTQIRLIREENDDYSTIIHNYASAETDLEFRDFTIEQGKTYTYSLQILGEDGETWEATPDHIINADYEDMFLSNSYDQHSNFARQLKVRYNPTVSAIHETILESKTDTIGGKYPFFSRNQSVRYRDFQIGGLISLQMDEQHLFSELQSLPDQPSRERTQTTAAQDNQYLEDIKAYGYSSSLTDYSAPNYYRERMFRDEVLAWLNDGEYKLFRSPSEGMLIVRLLSVNMTPYNGTGRMVYSFTAQAYEAMGHDVLDLVDFGFLDIKPIPLRP